MNLSKYKFSKTSLEHMEGVDSRLVDLAFRVLSVVDCKIIDGLRSEAEQIALVAEGKSKTMNSKHLVGRALDMAPYPIDWGDTCRFYWFAGVVLGVAHEMGIKIRWGGDWDSDNDLRDQSFNDLVHFELA